MIAMYSQEQYDSAKSTHFLPCKCEMCSDTFHVVKTRVTQVLSGKRSNEAKYCSKQCRIKSQETKVSCNCTCCNKPFKKRPTQMSASGNNFCSQSCSTSYNNTHKTKGTRRSKLEVYVEEQLSLLYPSLEIIYNDKQTISSELDIYIPSLNVAFELNGIFHYEPIYGLHKFQQIQTNDKNKFQQCINAGINLCIIDTSSHKYVKPSTSQKYLDVITQIINERVALQPF